MFLSFDEKRVVLPFSGKLNAILKKGKREKKQRKRKRKENPKENEKCVAHSVWDLASLQLAVLIAIQSRFPQFNSLTFLCHLSIVIKASSKSEDCRFNLIPWESWVRYNQPLVI